MRAARLWLTALLLWVGAATGYARDVDELMDLDLEELFTVQVSLVSRRAEDPLAAPAAVYVLTGEDIRRSGATTIPEALRLVPGMHVGRIHASQWAVAARGANLRFANRLLVLIDGRSVYTPTFSGVYWEVQDVAVGDVARIEVVRGPGATLWGVNAVNGVVNIVTRAAADTQGLQVRALAGTEDRAILSGRYGGTSGTTAYRLYGQYADRDGLANRAVDRRDPWSKGQGGFRVDGRTAAGQRWTVQGGGYRARLEQTLQLAVNDSPLVQRVYDEATVDGFNVLGRWQQSFEKSGDVEVQAYVDYLRRDEAFLTDRRYIADIDMQHIFSWGSRHEVVWGLGGRLSADRYDNSFTVRLLPEKRRLYLLSALVQDDISLVQDRLRLVAGTKLSRDEYGEVGLQPSLRLAWKPSPRQAVWAAWARALRSPARIEADGALILPAASFNFATGDELALIEFAGGTSIKSERLRSIEMGYRFRTRGAMLEATAFRTRYDRVTLFELVSGAYRLEQPQPHLRIPVKTGKTKGGIIRRGIELNADLRPFDGARLKLSYAFLDAPLADPSEVSQATDVNHQATAVGRWTSRRGWQGDGVLRYVGELDNGRAGSYLELDLRLAFDLNRRLQLALVGRNLLQGRHAEFFNDLFNVGQGLIGRSAHVELVWGR